MASAVARGVEVAVEGTRASAYNVTTDRPESDGTFEWGSTTIVLVEVEAGGETGLGWTYCTAAAARVVDELLAEVVCGRSALDVGGVQLTLRAALRNAGYPGIGASPVTNNRGADPGSQAMICIIR